VALVCPAFAVATAEAYAWLDADRAEAGWHATPMLDKVPDRWSDFPAQPRNDLEPPVSRRHPEIAQSIAELRTAGARIAGMSGSGSTVFGVFDEAPDAATLARAGLRAVVFTHTLANIDPVQLLD
jgi:4-diphosphocytidyl-2-C-methyl-D-erythritol kinase